MTPPPPSPEPLRQGAPDRESQDRPRIGLDFGGTKIEAAVLLPDGTTPFRERVTTPRGDYAATIEAAARLVDAADRVAGGKRPVGAAIPGSLSPRTGLVQNANSTWLNAKPFGRDLESALARPVRLANDANCFALSEAEDGAAQGAASVFGVILGTGCGGGFVTGGRIVDGPNGCGGEWGHLPLPWPRPEDLPGPACWCGRRGCLETYLSGTGLEARFAEATGRRLTTPEIANASETGDGPARAAMEIYEDRLARGLALVATLLDPEIIVLGGGLSNLARLYRILPEKVAPHVFADGVRVRIVPPLHGDSSGVRGAARLWPA